MARLPNISKYCTVWRSSAAASSKVCRKLVPSMGSCSMPSTLVGTGNPMASSTVGAMSMQWVNWPRSRVGSDPARPGDHHRIAGTAEVAGHLLAPLKRGVVGVRPRRGEMRRGVLVAERLDSAVLLDELQLLIGVENHTVEECHLVERAGDRAFHAGAVVAPDVEDQRVVASRRDPRSRRAVGRRSSRRFPRTRRTPPSAGHRASSRSPTGCPRPGTGRVAR